MNNAFLTGSHVYGTPTEDSDVDIVVLMDLEEEKRLRQLAGCETGPIRFGTLNIIACIDKRRFDAFEEAKRRLLAVTAALGTPPFRDLAVRVHREVCHEYGVPDMGDSSGPDGDDRRTGVDE